MFQGEAGSCNNHQIQRKVQLSLVMPYLQNETAPRMTIFRPTLVRPDAEYILHVMTHNLDHLWSYQCWMEIRHMYSISIIVCEKGHKERSRLALHP